MTLTEWLNQTLFGADIDTLRRVADSNAAAWIEDPAFNDSAAACVRAVRAGDNAAARFFAQYRHIERLPYGHAYVAYWPGRYYRGKERVMNERLTQIEEKYLGQSIAKFLALGGDIREYAHLVFTHQIFGPGEDPRDPELGIDTEEDLVWALERLAAQAFLR